MQRGKLVLNGVTFQAVDCEQTRFYVFESDEDEETITISFDVQFSKAQFDGEETAPYMVINEHETGKCRLEELAGCTFSADSIEEAEEREDTLYIHEHEPFVKYRFTILETAGEMVHIQMEGTAVTDGYAEPNKTADFSGDFWLKYEP